MKDGILLVDKPAGLTSYDVVEHIKRKFKLDKIGHAGTLDPMATGLLIILVGRYTKYFNKLVHYDKEYEATITLGATTDTGDSQGKIINSQQVREFTDEEIRCTFNEFLGQTEQIPPMVSALRFKGKRLYALARKGIAIPRKPRAIRIEKLEIKKINLPHIDFYVMCSKGTYIRSLAQDIGQKFGCGGHISSIRRLNIGPFSIKQALVFDNLKNLNNLDEIYIRPE